MKSGIAVAIEVVVAVARSSLSLKRTVGGNLPSSAVASTKGVDNRKKNPLDWRCFDSWLSPVHST